MKRPETLRFADEFVDEDCMDRYNKIAFVGVCRNSSQWHQKGFQYGWRWLRTPLHVGIAEFETWCGFLHLLCEGGFSVPPHCAEPLRQQFDAWPRNLCEAELFQKGIISGLGLDEDRHYWCDCWTKPGERRTIEDSWNYIKLRKRQCNVFTELSM